MLTFNLDTRGKTAHYNKHWEFCIGSCHAATALREDYRNQLKTCKKELGFKYLRFHGLFDDDMSVFTKSIFTGKYTLSFINIDSIFDFLLSIHMKPFIELSFMPECLKSGEETIFHYKGNITPPSDENLWAWFIKQFVAHLIDRYGRSEVRSWFFEVWNEPNLGGESAFCGGRFWSGTMQDYYRLYQITAEAVKSVDACLMVGGPATSNNAHIPDMIAFCKTQNVALDFISTHHYPTDVVLGYGVEDSQNFVNAFNKTDKSDKQSLTNILQQFITFQESIWSKVKRGVLTDMARRARSEAGDLPLYYTEWNSLAGIESDGAFGASFIAKTCLDNVGIIDGSSYWTFSDIFEERPMMSAAFHGGYGLMTLQGIKKATYRAFQLLHHLSGQMLGEVYRNDTVDCYAFYNGKQKLYQVLAVNHQSLLHDISEQKVVIKLNSAQIFDKADVLRVDENNANALQKWKEMGSPEYLSESQINLLNAASQLDARQLNVQIEKDFAQLELELPKQAIALVTFYIKE